MPSRKQVVTMLPTSESSHAEPEGLLGFEGPEPVELSLGDDLAWLRRRIGRFVEGGVYLIAGQPGIGKSTLGIQIALELGRQGIQTVFILTEQSVGDLSSRARLMVSAWDRAEANAALDHVKPVETLYDVANLPSLLAHEILSRNGKYRGAKLIVLDSIQGQGLAAGATRQYKQVYDFCRQCKSEGITTLLVAHVTKKGDISGPKDLEHNVDCVLYMRKALSYRPLFVPKNRFGPAVLQPIPLQMNKRTTALELSPHTQTQSTVARTFFGTGIRNAEAQAAIALPSYGTRGAITAPGLPRKEIEQLLSCISQLPEMDIADMSYTIQCRLPGERRYRRLLDLPLAMALIASYLQREIPAHHLYIGELDLLRRVREVPEEIVQQMWEAVESGELSVPIRIFCPVSSADLIRTGISDATVVACERLEDAVYGTWPDIAPVVDGEDRRR